MSRVEAAAKAVEDATNHWPHPVWSEGADTVADSALAAADAHDAAHGIHRVSLDDATVERAARAMLDAFYDDKTLKVDDEDRDIVRAVLAAAVEADHV